MGSLQRLISRLGGLVEVVSGSLENYVEVSDIVVYDPSDPPEMRPHDVVLGVGLNSHMAAQLIGDMGSAAIGALFVKGGNVSDSDLAQVARRNEIAVVLVPSRISWAQLLALLKTLLSVDPSGDKEEELHGVELGDLFAVADAVAALMDAPVAIEDPDLRVIAYSERQDEADSGRIETILDRKAPKRYVRRLEEAGVLEDVYRHEGPVYFDAMLPGLKPRLVVAIRAGDELLGSMTAVVKGLPQPQQQNAFAEAAKLVSLHLLRQRLTVDSDRRVQASLLASLLDGELSPSEAAERLGLRGSSFRVIAARLAIEGQEGHLESQRRRLWDALALHSSIFHLGAPTALLGGVAYAVVPVPPDLEQGRAKALRIAGDFLERSTRGLSAFVGIGGPAESIREIPRSRLEADLAVRALRERPSMRIAEIEDVRLQALLTRVRDLAGDDPLWHTADLSKLMAHDTKHGTRYVETLKVHLDSWGAVGEASATLKIHPNSLRHRLSRIQQIAGIDLKDPEERLAIMLELRLFHHDSERD